MSFWFHCNKCFLQLNSSNSTKYLLSNCGHIYCEKCLATCEPNHCYLCRSACSTIALTSNLPADVQIFFGNPNDSIQNAAKVSEFQRNHCKSLLEHKDNELRIVKNKYEHAKEYIKKQSRQYESLYKEHQRLRNLFKESLAPGSGSFRTPAAPGSKASTPTVTPISGSSNRFMWNQSGSQNMLNKTVSSIQGSAQFRTPSVYQPTPSVKSVESSGSRTSQGRAPGAPSGGGYPRPGDFTRPAGYNRPLGFNRPTPSPINLDRLSFGSGGRKPNAP